VAFMIVSSLIACSSPSDEEIEDKSAEIADRFMAALFSTMSSAECEGIVDELLKNGQKSKLWIQMIMPAIVQKVAELKAVSNDLDDLEKELDKAVCK